jgi:hypothetical protein
LQAQTPDFSGTGNFPVDDDGDRRVDAASSLILLGPSSKTFPFSCFLKKVLAGNRWKLDSQNFLEFGLATPNRKNYLSVD